jgi:VWFA-related protein
MRWMKCSRKNIARQVSLRRTGVSPAFAVLTVTVLLLSGSAIPQETTFRAQSNIVLLPALVKDAQDGVVYGLEAKDFVVEDDGVVQSARLDEAPEGQPISLVVAIQKGRRASYEFERIKGLKTMIDPLFSLGTARVAIVEFDSQVALSRDFSRDESLIDADLSNLQPGDEGATILDAIQYSVGLLRKEPQERLRVLLLISETRDHGSKVKIEDAVSSIGRSNSLMYALAFSPALSNILDTGRGNNKNEMHPGVNFLDLMYQTAQAMRKNVPSTVTSMTGGEYELFTSRKKFEGKMNDFTNHLHSRYLLSFYPKEPHAGLHQVRVRLKEPKDDTVLARTSYFAEAAK